MLSAPIETPQALVVQRILANYGRASIRPGVWKSWVSRNPTPERDLVQVQFGVEKFSNLFVRTQEWGVSGYFRTWWHDPRLAFNATEAATDSISLPLSDTALIWQPETYLERVLHWSDVKATDGLSEGLTIFPDGTVWRSQQRSATMSCLIDLSRMPFDTQTCGWKMGMYTAQEHDVRLTWFQEQDAFDGWDRTCPSGWAPTGMRQENIIESWPSGNYSYAAAYVDFTRRDAEQLYFSYAFVAMALVGLSYFGFFINPAATPARVALGIITILSVLSNRNALIASMPPGSKDVWLLDFLSACFVFNLLAFAEQVVTAYARRTVASQQHAHAFVHASAHAPTLTPGFAHAPCPGGCQLWTYGARVCDGGGARSADGGGPAERGCCRSRRRRSRRARPAVVPRGTPGAYRRRPG